MERVDYSKPGAVRGVIRNFSGLMALAEKGDQMAHIVCIDIRRAVYKKDVLTFKQRRYLLLWWKGHSYTDIAAMYRKNPSVIQRRIELAIKNISEYLTGKGSFDR